MKYIFCSLVLYGNSNVCLGQTITGFLLFTVQYHHLSHTVALDEKILVSDISADQVGSYIT